MPATTSALTKVFQILGICIMIAFVMYIAQAILIPITVALFFTFLLYPISDFLESKKFPKWLSILISITAALVIVCGLMYFFISKIMSFKDDLPELTKNLESKVNQLQSYIDSNTNFSKKDQTKWIDENLEKVSNDASSYVMNIFSATSSALADLVLIPIYIFFMTYYGYKFKRFIALVTSKDEQPHVFGIVTRISRVSQQYVKGMLTDILILAVLNSVGFLILGINHAILFGSLAAILNIIPYIGVLIGSLLPMMIALLTKDSMWYAVGVAGVCTFVQFIDNNFIMPKVVGSSVSLNPLTATIALIIGGSLWGVMGMILFIPLTGMIKVLCDNIESTKPYGYILGESDEIGEGTGKIS